MSRRTAFYISNTHQQKTQQRILVFCDLISNTRTCHYNAIPFSTILCHISMTIIAVKFIVDNKTIWECLPGVLIVHKLKSIKNIPFSPRQLIDVSIDFITKWNESMTLQKYSQFLDKIYHKNQHWTFFFNKDKFHNYRIYGQRQCP